MPKVNMQWKGGYCFEADLDGHKILVDLPEESGGNNLGPTPMLLLLPSLATCSAVGVVGILKKMRVPEFKLNIVVDADKTPEHPKYYSKIDVYYNFNGEGLNPKKLRKAVAVSEERYCGVNLMLSKTAEINSIITINGEEV